MRESEFSRLAWRKEQKELVATFPVIVPRADWNEVRQLDVDNEPAVDLKGGT
jgi:hypothetical protein